MSVTFNPDPLTGYDITKRDPWGVSPSGGAISPLQDAMNQQAIDRMRNTRPLITVGSDGTTVNNITSGSMYTDPARTHFTVREIGNGFTVSQGDTELYAADMADVGNKVVALFAAKKMKEK